LFLSIYSGGGNPRPLIIEKARLNRVCLSDKAKHKVGTYLVGFMDPELAGVHATHGSVPVFSVAFLQSISRVPQADIIYLP
jgi:hypothetical protein